MKGKNDGTKINLDVWFRQNVGGGRMEEKNRRGITEKEEWRKKNGRRRIVDE
jgi:hypothetical protein